MRKKKKSRALWPILLLLLPGIFLAIYQLVRPQKSGKMVSPSGKVIMRNDSQGSGHFGASRGGRVHEGLDLEVDKGQPVYAPFDGEIYRYSNPYASDPKYKGCAIKGSDKYAGFEAKIWYFTPNGLGIVKKGDVIGYAQAISEKYGESMKDHIHFQLYKDGALVNPLSYLS